MQIFIGDRWFVNPAVELVAEPLPSRRMLLGTAQELEQEFLPAVMALPPTKTYVKNEVGFIAPRAEEVVFTLSGEYVFLDRSSRAPFFGALNNSANLLIVLSNELGERCLINFNSAFKIDWNKIFGMFSTRDLEMRIIGSNDFKVQGHNNFKRLAESLSAHMLSSTVGTRVNIVSQFTMRTNVILSPDESYVNSQLEERYWNARSDDSSHRKVNYLTVNAGTVRTADHCQAAFFGVHTNEFRQHDVAGTFLTSVIISPQMEVYEVSTENYCEGISLARAARALEGESLREDHMFDVGCFAKQNLLLVQYKNNRIDLGRDDDINLIARLGISDNFLGYAASRASYGREELTNFFRDKVASGMIYIDTITDQYQALVEKFAQRRVETIFFVAKLHELRAAARAEEKPPGPWAEGCHFSKP